MILSLRIMAQGESYQVGFELYRANATEFSDFVFSIFERGGNAGIDDNDLPKLNFGGGEKLSVYSWQQNWGIETRPLTNCKDSLQLRLYNTPTTSTDFRLVVDMTNYPVISGLTAVLEDRFLGKERALKFGDTTIINFTTTSNINTTGLRFRVVFKRLQVQTSPFTQLAPVCRGDEINLPTTSSNGIVGTWSPALDNTQTTTYTFVPSEGQCATNHIMTVDVNQPLTPLFNSYGPFNSGTNFSLPLTSINGISGSWSPAINNAQTTTYEFTPADGQCANTAYLTVTINDLSTAIEDYAIVNTYKLYPNPVVKGSGVLRFELNNNLSGKYLLSVYTSNGVCIKNFYLQHGGGSATYSLYTDQRWTSGIYLIRILRGNELKDQKTIVIQ